MIASAQVIAAAKSRGERFPQFVPALGHSIRADQVVDLIVASTSPAAQRGAREVLRDMSCTSWRVVAAAHSNDNDATRHITVEIGRIRYHLRLDSRGCIFDITSFSGDGVQRVSGKDPWVAPGA